MRGLIKVIPLTYRAVFSQSIFIDWEGMKMLLDVGPGAVAQIINLKLPLAKIGAALISHSHIDHFWDLIPFLWLKRMRGSGSGVRIFYPREDEDLIDWCVRVAGAEGFTEKVGLAGGEEVDVKGVSIKPFQADHETSRQALGYLLVERERRKLRVDLLEEMKIPKVLWKELAKTRYIVHEGRGVHVDDVSFIEQRRLVYSGDTRPNRELVEASRKADLLIIDSTYMDDLPHQTIEVRGHMRVREALEIASTSNVKRVLLTHLSLRYTLKQVSDEAGRLLEKIPCPPTLYVGDEKPEF